jgi:hypothetical protein
MTIVTPIFVYESIKFIVRYKYWEEIFISPIFYFIYRFFTSVCKTAEPLVYGQRAGGGVESAITIIAYHSLSPSFSLLKSIIFTKSHHFVISIHVDGQLGKKGAGLTKFG